jgi:hypothetical protein
MHYLRKELKRIGTSDYYLVPRTIKELVGIDTKIKVSVEKGRIIIEADDEVETCETKDKYAG